MGSFVAQRVLAFWPVIFAGASGAIFGDQIGYAFGLSIGVQKGPPIGVQKRPPSSGSVTVTDAPFALVAA